MKKSNDFFGQLLSRGPSQSTLFWVLKEMKKEGRSSEVIRECLKALSTYPDDIRLRGLLAESYLDVGFVGQAEAELDRVASEIANLVSAFKLQAYIYIRQERAEEAIKALRRYLAHNPDDREALDLLDRVEQKQRSVEETAEEEQAPAYQEPIEEISPPAEEQREVMTEPVMPTLEETLEEQAPAYQQPAEEISQPADDEREEITELVMPTLEEQAPAYQQPIEEISPPVEGQKEGVPELATPPLEQQVPEYQPPAEEISQPADDEREEMPELATPTLAEIHYNQGQIQEAIRIYEKVLLESPDDDVSQKRLSELRALIDEETATRVVAEDKSRTSKEEMISVLEVWLERIKESGNA